MRSPDDSVTVLSVEGLAELLGSIGAMPFLITSRMHGASASFSEVEWCIFFPPVRENSMLGSVPRASIILLVEENAIFQL